ncbi:MAG: hypothetical protein QN135_01825 [Armatimonadota bacterium]|nr:hypothetical protein [Armatimonadota bacterium]
MRAVAHRPRTRAPAAPPPVDVHLRRLWQDALLVFLHGPGCAGCVQIASQLVRHWAEWDRWGTGVIVLRSDPSGFSDVPFPQIHDPGGGARQAYGGAADAVLACLDHRGRWMAGWTVTHPEAVDWHEVAQTVRWVAIQEPECAACAVEPAWED